MPVTDRSRIRGPRGGRVAEVSASDAKNAFGNVLDQVSREGIVAITKHDRPCAVLISLDVYQAMTPAPERVLDGLAQEFDALYQQMQQPGMTAAMQKAFAMTPGQLGRAAVKFAGAGSKQRARTETAEVPAKARAGAVDIIGRRRLLEAAATSVAAKVTQVRGVRRGRG